MRKVFLLAVLGCVLFAAKDDAGVIQYKANCRICHGAPYKGSTMLTSSEWEDMFANSYKKLRAVHEKDEKALKVIDDSKFVEDSKKLIEFLKNNAQDSGNVRSCSGVSCG